jgi:hypothetical protein
MRGHSRLAWGALLLALFFASVVQAETTLVVAQDAGGRAVTHWLESDGNAHEIKAVLPLPLFAVGDVVHAWRTVPAELALCDCEAISGWKGSGLCPSAGATGRGSELQLISLADGRLDSPVPARRMQPGEIISAYRAEVRFLGSIGPYVFTQLEERLGSCLSKEEIQVSKFVVWDLAGARSAVLFDRREIGSLRTGEQVEAFDLLRDDTTADNFKGVDFTAIHPVWSGQELALKYQFTAPVCTTCGDGEWSSGTKSAYVPAEVTPRKLLPWGVAPRGLATFRMAHPDSKVLGWTQLDGTQAERDAQLTRLLGMVR